MREERSQAWTLNSLAAAYATSGQPRPALRLIERVNNIYENQTRYKSHLAIGLGNMATQQLVIAELRAAEASLRRCIALCQETKSNYNEGISHAELGSLLAYCGSWSESETELDSALALFANKRRVQAQGFAWIYRALRELLLLRHASLRANLKFEIADLKSVIAPARRTLELADETARTRFPFERDYVRAHWLLGAAYRVAGQTDEAERHLHEALERCRRINMVDHEADILIDLARLRPAAGAPDEAQRLAEEALLITERNGYVLQGADAHLELAKLALNLYSVGPSCGSARTRGSASLPDMVSEAVKRASSAQREAARHHALEARTLATCDGPPDYTYKAAYDEAGALLAQLG